MITVTQPLHLWKPNSCYSDTRAFLSVAGLRSHDDDLETGTWPKATATAIMNAVPTAKRPQPTITDPVVHSVPSTVNELPPQCLVVPAGTAAGAGNAAE